MKSIRNFFHPVTAPMSEELSTAPQLAYPSMGTQSIASNTPVTVIELFQSQGCNSCPPANDHCIALAKRNDPSLLLLTYEVTYWDHLGWPDTFGDARWDARQRDYAAALRQRSCYTPQVIVDGGAKPLGGGWRNLPAVLESANGSPEAALRFELQGTTRLRIEGETASPGLVLVVFYEVEPQPVRILRGENRGETLPHRNVVRNMVFLGKWEGTALEVSLPARCDGLEMAVLVQAGNGGQILGALRL